MVAPTLWLLAAATRAGIEGAAAARLLEPRAWSLLGRTLGIALAATTGAALLGAPLGILIARAQLPGRRLLLTATLLALCVPPVVAAIAWSILLGRGGPLGQLFPIAGGPSPPGAAPGVAGVVVALVALYWPVVALLVARAARAVPAEWEEAARLETTPWRAFTLAAGAHLRASLGVAALLVFLLVLADYDVPGTMGVAVYPVEILSAFQATRDYGHAAALALPLLLLILPLLLLQEKWQRASISDAGEAHEAPPLPLGRWRWPLVLAAWLIPLATTVAPLVRLWRDSLPAATYADALAAAAGPIRVGLQTAATAALATTVLALLVAVALAGPPLGARLPPFVTRALDRFALLPYALPGALLGIAWIALLNRPGPLGELYASIWVLPLCYASQFFPFAYYPVAHAVRRLDPSLTEAARLDGASSWAIARLIVAPLARGPLIVGAALVAVLAGRELDATSLLRPPGSDTLGFLLHDLYHYGPSRQVAALGVVAALATALLIALAWALVERWAERVSLPSQR